MSATTINLEMDTEQMRKIFGMQDAYIKKLEQDFQVTIVDRNGSIIITGEEENTGKASRVLRQLTALSDRGNDIEEQSVDYAIEMGKEDQEDRLMEMDADCICHTINGKPIKPKTLGLLRTFGAEHLTPECHLFISSKLRPCMISYFPLFHRSLIEIFGRKFFPANYLSI